MFPNNRQTPAAAAILLSIISALFFASTFILNKMMANGGGYWGWSAGLRFFIMLPLLIAIVYFRGGLTTLFSVMKRQPLYWLLWSSVGFGLFYAMLTYAAAYCPPWLLAATWQISIVAGMIISPIINDKNADGVPIQTTQILWAFVILIGVGIMQIQHIRTSNETALTGGLLPVLISAFAYPLGNRKMMQATYGTLDSWQRTTGMTIASMPFWIVVIVFSLLYEKLPSQNQILDIFIVAVFSGVLGTALFFKASTKAYKNPALLVSVEAMQATELLFVVLGELIFLGKSIPDIISIIGVLVLLVGIIFHSRSGLRKL